MANTRRESTAFCGGESYSDLAGLIPIPALGLRPHLSTSIGSICQGISDLPLPASAGIVSRIASAVDISYALHNRANGSMVSLMHGNMADRKLFSVAICPERTIEFWERPSWQELFDFAQANVELLLKPRHAIGTWFNDYELTHVFDIVICLPDRDDAMDLGLRFHQKAIFDLESCQEIQIVHRSQTLPLSRVGGVYV